ERSGARLMRHHGGDIGAGRSISRSKCLNKITYVAVTTAATTTNTAIPTIARWESARSVLPCIRRWNPRNHAGGTSAIHGSPRESGPPRAGRCDTSGRHTTSDPSTALRMTVDNAWSRLQETARTSTPTTAVIVRMANADAVTLAMAQLASRRMTLVSPHGFIDVRIISGTSDTCAAAVNNPVNIRSAVSLARNTTIRRTGIGPRMRK